MANYYTQFCEVIRDLTEGEAQWWAHQTEYVLCDEDGNELPDEFNDGDAVACDFEGPRFMRDPAAEDFVAGGIDFTVREEEGSRVLAISDDAGEGSPEVVVYLVQKFLKQFRSRQYFVFSWAGTCDKVRNGAFAGGTAVITATDVMWSSDLLESYLNELLRARPGLKSANQEVD